MEPAILINSGNIMVSDSIKVVYKQSELYRTFLGGLVTDGFGMPPKAAQDYSDPEIDRLVLAGFIDLLNIPQGNINNEVKSVLGPSLYMSGGANGSRFNENGLLITELPADRPRYNFNPDTGLYEGVNLEVQDTNHNIHSTALDQTYWKLDLSEGFMELSSVISPEGELNSNRSQKMNITYDIIYKGMSSVVDNSFYKSIFIRTVSGSGVVQSLKHNSVIAGLFDINEKWKRFSLQFNTSETGGTSMYIVDWRAVGNTVVEALFYGAQTSNYNTSYIKTTTATVTRPADTYTAIGAITGPSYSIYKNLNNDKIAEYYHDGNKITYINGVLSSTVVQAPSNDISLSSTGSDKLKTVALREGTITEQELISVTS